MGTGIFNVSNTREELHGYCWQSIPVRSVRNLTGIAQSDIPELDTPEQDGSNGSLFVFYEINETCTANWGKRKLLIFRSVFFVVNLNRANMDSPSSYNYLISHLLR